LGLGDILHHIDSNTTAKVLRHFARPKRLRIAAKSANPFCRKMPVRFCLVKGHPGSREWTLNPEKFSTKQVPNHKVRIINGQSKWE
jgi:hypothetical protein